MIFGWLTTVQHEPPDHQAGTQSHQPPWCFRSSAAPASPAAAEHQRQSEPNQNSKLYRGRGAVRIEHPCLFPKLFCAADGLAALAGELALLGLLLALELGVQLAPLVLVLDLRWQYRRRLILLRPFVLALPPLLALAALRSRPVGGRLLPLLLLRHRRREVAAVSAARV